MAGHLTVPQNGILYTNAPSMSSHLHYKVTSPVSQGWLFIAGSTVQHIGRKIIFTHLSCYHLQEDENT